MADRPADRDPKARTENRLAQETSPCLLQHKDNPVDWWTWGPEALAEAKRTGKPILLSVGCAACHWCHVLAHESFENRATAELMSELYIIIEVDREEPPDVDAILERTLVHICQGGIYDHPGGSFARYSVDERWLVPHFEKMLYDNALRIDLMTEVWRATSNPMLQARVAETVAWLELEMLAGDGIAASLDVDSEGEEGRFYVWTHHQIASVLGEEDARVLASHYDVTRGGNWAGHTILDRLSSLALLSEADESRLAGMRRRRSGARPRHPGRFRLRATTQHAEPLQTARQHVRRDVAARSCDDRARKNHVGPVDVGAATRINSRGARAWARRCA